LTLFSPSKVNLFLRILGRREDGFHDLASLFQAIGLGDIISISLGPARGNDWLTSDSSRVPTNRHNLILKAVDVFKKKTGIKQAVRAHLRKRVPVEAGLGGGSANAATTLWALNELFKTGLSDAELAELGAEFGSDISFFLSKGTTYCTGRGEILQSVPPLPNTRVHIFKPAQGLSTRVIFQSMDLNALSDKDPAILLDRFLSGSQTSADYVNDLETPSFKALPILSDLKTRLESEFPVVLMSGSGTSFYCLNPIGNESPLSREQAERLLKGFTQPVTCFTTTFVNRTEGSWYEGTAEKIE